MRGVQKFCITKAFISYIYIYNIKEVLLWDARWLSSLLPSLPVNWSHPLNDPHPWTQVTCVATCFFMADSPNIPGFLFTGTVHQSSRRTSLSLCFISYGAAVENAPKWLQFGALFGVNVHKWHMKHYTWLVSLFQVQCVFEVWRNETQTTDFSQPPLLSYRLQRKKVFQQRSNISFLNWCFLE